MLNVSAVILAAGSGSRIGLPKLKLQIKGKYFVNVIIEKLISADINNIFAVIREDYYEWCLENVPGALFVLNNEPEKGMFHSVKLGIKNSVKSDGILIFPVDYPFVEKSTIEKLKAAFIEYPECIIKPVFDNKSGHPLIIPKFHFDAIINSKLDNLNDAIMSLKISQVKVNVNDKSVLKNVNYKSDL
jgi:molybdenum cofactor cytidylyltransferase